MPPSKHDGGIEKELATLIRVMEENGRQAQEERKQLAAKVDNIPSLFAEQRRELERVFVPISRYDPEREAILRRLQTYDDIILRGQGQQAEYEQLKAQVKQNTQAITEHDEDIESVKERAHGAVGRALPYLAIGISILAAIINLFEHVHIN